MSLFKNLGWASPSARIARPFELFNPLGQLGLFYMDQGRFYISKATYPFSLTHLVFMQQIHYLQIAIVTPEGNNPPCPGKVGHTIGIYVQYSVQCWSRRGLSPQLPTLQTGALLTALIRHCYLIIEILTNLVRVLRVIDKHFGQKSTANFAICHCSK